MFISFALQGFYSFPCATSKDPATLTDSLSKYGPYIVMPKSPFEDIWDEPWRLFLGLKTSPQA